MPDIYGNTSGLGPAAQKALERIYRRRVPLDSITTPELVASLADASRETKRQVGALVHRSGVVDCVIVGTATGLMLPDIGRLRAAQGRFRALRLIHTHLFGEPLSRDDLVDLTRLRLDLVAAVLLSETKPRALTWAYNTPPGPDGRAYHVTDPTPLGHPLPHFGELMTSLEAEFAQRTQLREHTHERAILCHIGEKRQRGAVERARTGLRELTALAETAGVEVADTVLQLRDKIDANTVMGRGKLEEVLIHAIDIEAGVLIFDRDLSATQASSIAARTDLRVLDRTQLILDIFAQHAETRDGKLQVELAQLKYRLPRLGLKDDSLSRLTGGIGGRGPGETKLEIGRRRARERITRLERELAQLARQRDQRRRRRNRSPLPIVSFVGYTNAGKSTLLNALTGADVLAADKLFATLDTRARQLYLPGGTEAVATDTVGFIRDMPKDLFAAFRSTFEEAADSDLLLEVVDASSDETEAHMATTDGLLEKLGLAHLPRLRVLNKIDRVSPEEAAALVRDDRSIAVSAHAPADIARLAERLAAELVRARGAAEAAAAAAAP